MTDNMRDDYSVDDALADLGQRPAKTYDESEAGSAAGSVAGSVAESVPGRTATDTAPRSTVPGSITGAADPADPVNAAAAEGGGRGSARRAGGTGGGSAGGGPTGSAGAVIRRIRDLLASALLTVAVLAAAVLGLGAVLTALGANPENAITSTVRDLGSQLDGPFADLFTFAGEPGKQLLVNWAIAALAYLVVGRVLERVLRP